LWSTEDVTTREQRLRRIEGRSSCKRSSCAIYDAEVVRRHGIEGIEKLKKEEQKG